MPEALAVFLHTFSPRPICHRCLINLLGDPADEVEHKLHVLRASGRIEADRAECLNCGELRLTVRVAPGQTIEDVA